MKMICKTLSSQLQTQSQDAEIIIIVTIIMLMDRDLVACTRACIFRNRPA